MKYKAVCRWCGRELRYEYTIPNAKEVFEHVWEMPGNTPEETKARKQYVANAKVRAAQPGWQASGAFCTLRCGFNWAVRHINSSTC